MIPDMILPTPEWNHAIWSGGHFWSGREPSSPVYDPTVNRRAHAGIDLAAPEGSPLVSPADGTVAVIDHNPGAGNWLAVLHVVEYNGGHRHLFTRHLHIRSGSIRVEVGDVVQQGQRLADVGNTGASAGPHDHFEILWDVPQASYTSGKHIDPEWILFGVTPWSKEPGMAQHMQEALRDAGWDIEVDGIWGPSSQAALTQAFQLARDSVTRPMALQELANHAHYQRRWPINRRTGGVIR